MSRNPSNQKKIIAVCGAASISSEIYHIVENLGYRLAKEGYRVACGGLGGTMEAIAKGAKRANGLTLGIIPSIYKRDANEYIDIIIPTGMGEARNVILVSTADIIISVSGGSGTLSELALAWKMDKPIISLSFTGGWSEVLADTAIDAVPRPKIFDAKNLDDVFKILNIILG